MLKIKKSHRYAENGIALPSVKTMHLFSQAEVVGSIPIACSIKKALDHAGSGAFSFSVKVVNAVSVLLFYRPATWQPAPSKGIPVCRQLPSNGFSYIVDL
ncbi:hypothetical protein [Neobittarella massiliensis]|uniref:hypothetical protein n=1 Tax=Neobittarella massiliensis (ex Bilen et al. 2018) TaxID=2041842 RepID=UPI00101ADA84|nr:hypothetical protein [Neobittarella massiliensis]